VYADAKQRYEDFESCDDTEAALQDQLLHDKNEIEREIASSLINLCSLYSSMNKHEIALAYVLRANRLLETLFLAMIKN
jgi:hypothetical protein